MAGLLPGKYHPTFGDLERYDAAIRLGSEGLADE